jgi:hypothetical protein
LDDLLPLEEYAGRRREFFDSHTRYIDRYRRVRVGPCLSFVFQNRQTLWFHLHELLRVARLSERARVQQELDVYNRLLPARECLQAALLIEVSHEGPPADRLAQWKDLRGDEILLCASDRRAAAKLITCRPEDRCIGTEHWVEFAIDSNTRRALGEFHRPAHMEVRHGDYQHLSPALSEEVRQSLLDDLSMGQKA